MECTRHGITHLAVQGCYLKEDKDMLYTVLGEDEVKEVTALVHSLIRRHLSILSNSRESREDSMRNR